MAETKVPGTIIRVGTLPGSAIDPSNPLLDPTKLPLAGGTMTGELIVHSEAWNPYTTYLLHMDGASGSTGITDEIGHEVSLIGDNIYLSGATMKFGTASLSSPGATG